MVENILESFWYGNINPQDQSSEKNRAIKELLALMGRNRDKLCETITSEQQEVLEKYDDCINEMHSLIEMEIFAYAFRLGGRLMLATYWTSPPDPPNLTLLPNGVLHPAKGVQILPGGALYQ